MKELEKPQYPKAQSAQAFMLRGEILLSMESWEQARASFEQALERLPPDVLPPGHMSNLHHNLGLALMNLGLHKRALVHLERSLPLSAKAHGTDHPDYAIIVANIGMLLAKTGQRSQAVKKLQRALAIFEQYHGPGHPSTRRVQEELARLSG